MPELPEVESVVSALKSGNPPLTGLGIVAIDIKRSGIFTGMNSSDATELLTGLDFTEILRHGKYMFFGVGSGSVTRHWLCCHLRMTGRLFLLDEAEALDRFTRLVFYLTEGRVLRFDDMRGFGRFWQVESPDQVIGGLGPDALSVGYDLFKERVSSFRRSLKPLLLDQAVIAGVGNIYADEILFRAGLHPLFPSERLTADRLEKLYQSLRSVLEEAVAAKGANIDGVFEAGSFPVKVYGRAGQPCTVCSNTIVRIKVAQRGTHLCPFCQPVLTF